MQDGGNHWEEIAAEYQWLVGWRYPQRQQRWFIGGYSNVAMNVLDRHLETRSDMLAVTDQRRGHFKQRTYRDLYWASAGLARWWQDAGMLPGDRILIVGRPFVDGLVAWLAAARVGAVVVRTHAGCDLDLQDRMAAAEIKWVVVGDQSGYDQVRRVQNQLHESFCVLVSDDVRVDNTIHAQRLREALQEAHGLLDPVPVEANAIGVLLYGDYPQPYAYAAVGALMGWSESLSRLLDLQGFETVGLASEFGGLGDLLPLTIALLARGCSVRWVDFTAGSDWDLMSQIISKLIVDSTHERPALAVAESLQRVVILGPERASGIPERVERVVRAKADMTGGRYSPLDSLVPDRMDNPACDRSQVQREIVDGHPWERVGMEAGDRFRALLHDTNVDEVARTLDATGHDVLWVRVDGDTSGISEQLIRNHVAQIQSGARVVCVKEFPETEEGRVAGSVLASIGRGDMRIPLSGLRNPEVVEQLVRAMAASSASGLPTSGWLS